MLDIALRILHNGNMTTTTEDRIAPRCGNRKFHGAGSHHHETTAQVRLCHSRPEGVESIEEAARGAAWIADAVAPSAPNSTLANLLDAISCNVPVEPDTACTNSMARDLDSEVRETFGDATCEHGMSAHLCAGPGHYPMDRPEDDHPDTMSQMASYYHANCQDCPWDCASCPSNISAAQYEDEVAPHAPWDGLYTIEDPRSGIDHRTFRLRTQEADADFAPGKQVIAYLSGPDNEKDYTGFGFIDQNAFGYFVRVWSRHRDNLGVQRDAEQLLKDADNFLTDAKCIRCHRTLTVPASVHQGYGPECVKKVGI